MEEKSTARILNTRKSRCSKIARKKLRRQANTRKCTPWRMSRTFECTSIHILTLESPGHLYRSLLRVFRVAPALELVNKYILKEKRFRVGRTKAEEVKWWNSHIHTGTGEKERKEKKVLKRKRKAEDKAKYRLIGLIRDRVQRFLHTLTFVEQRMALGEEEDKTTTN